MEHPHALLDLVLKQHYCNRQEILEKANKILEDYHNNIINYQQALSIIYQLMSDLPSDILLFYLTTVPLPKKEEIVLSTSPLPNLMKQMLVPSYLNSIRPILLKYLNGLIAPKPVPSGPELKPTVVTTEPVIDENKTPGEPILVDTEDSVQLKSVIDENICKMGRKKGRRGGGRGKNKNKNSPVVKTYQAKTLGLLCANKVFQNYNYIYSKYTKSKIEALKLLEKEIKTPELSAQCTEVIKDAEKKIRILNTFKTGNVTNDIFKEYDDAEICNLRIKERNIVGEDIVDIQPEVLKCVDNFINRC